MRGLVLWIAIIIALLMALVMLPFMTILWLLGVNKILKKYEDFFDGIIFK